MTIDCLAYRSRSAMLGRLAVAAGLAVIFATNNASGQATVVTGPTAREPEVTASGRGETRLAPNFGIVMFGVTTRAGNAADAASQNAAKVASTLAALRDAGIATEDLSNEGYSLEPAYEDNGRRRSGFAARNAIRTRVNRIDQIGRVIDAGIGGGATEVHSVQFGATSMEEARRTAVVEAVKQARAEAALLATAAGGALGRLITISSSSAIPTAFGRLESVTVTAAGANVPTFISPRDLTVTAQAFGRWEFIPSPTR